MGLPNMGEGGDFKGLCTVLRSLVRAVRREASTDLRILHRQIGAAWVISSRLNVICTTAVQIVPHSAFEVLSAPCSGDRTAARFVELAGLAALTPSNMIILNSGRIYRYFIGPTIK